MARNDKTASAAARPDREQRLTELQLTLAETQRLLAEAILALSKGQATGVQLGAQPPIARGAGLAPFAHDGVLADENGVLFLRESGVEFSDNMSLRALASRNKRLRLEFTLMSPGECAENVALFDALKAYMTAQGDATIRTEAACGSP